MKDKSKIIMFDRFAEEDNMKKMGYSKSERLTLLAVISETKVKANLHHFTRHYRKTNSIERVE